METLQGVFPLVPAEALLRVLDICDQNVEAASDWLLEHDWHEVMEDDQDDANENDDEDGQDDDTGHETTRGHPNGVSVMNGNGTGENGTTHRDHSHQSAATAAPPEQPGFTMAVSTESALWRAPGRMHAANGGTSSRTHHRHTISHRRGDDDANGDYDSAGDPDGDSEDAEDEEDEEDDDDDDDEDDDGDANSYYDSGDESYFQHSAPQLAKRVKVTRDANANVSSSEHFWSSFDGQVVPKTLIELLNTTLTKVAHSTVTLLNKSSKLITEDEARPLLTSILKRVEEGYSPPRSASDRDAKSSRSGNSLSRILNSSPPDSVPDDFHPGQKRKRSEDPCPNAVPTGFFAHFFPISDLDMVWRSILHAHLFSSRFGPVVEFHTASTGAFSRRDFDELMHIHTNVASSSRSAALGLSPLSNLKCCLLLPCDAREEEIYRVGKHLHTLLKLPGSLYYRTLTDENDQEDSSQELLNEDNKLTEESFRRFARYRIKKEEVESADKSDKDTVGGIDHFLSYQQQRKVNLCLQVLEKDAWVQRISD